MKYLLLFTCLSCQASINDIRAVYGEACGEPYQAKLGVSAVIRNRGSLNGVYGIHSKQLSHISPKAWKDCERAWNESATNDITHGCKFFGGKIDDKYFAKLGMKPVMMIGHTRFYR